MRLLHIATVYTPGPCSRMGMPLGIQSWFDGDVASSEGVSGVSGVSDESVGRHALPSPVSQQQGGGVTAS